MSSIPWLDSQPDFPPVESALTEPNGLLAAGGDLNPVRLINAYRQGVFPWFSEHQPILWWSPDPRCVLFPNQVHISRSLRKHIRKHQPQVSFDTSFARVIHHCASEREDDGTWITEDMEAAYIELHERGVAHSIEVWQQDQLIGGLYGLAIGRCFFGESMFSLKANASKVAFTALARQLDRWEFAVIDCQVENPHLFSLGAELIDRQDFSSILKKYIDLTPRNEQWQFDEDILSVL